MFGDGGETRMAARRKHLKLIGPASWDGVEYPGRGQIRRAIVREGNRLVIDLEFNGWEYSVTLDRDTGDLFSGSWSCQDGSTIHRGSASARLYSSESNWLLFGDWFEEGDRYHWWAELCSVERFPDEGQD